MTDLQSWRRRQEEQRIEKKNNHITDKGTGKVDGRLYTKKLDYMVQ